MKEIVDMMNRNKIATSINRNIKISSKILGEWGFTILGRCIKKLYEDKKCKEHEFITLIIQDIFLISIIDINILIEKMKEVFIPVKTTEILDYAIGFIIVLTENNLFSLKI